jgi:hypothetical protein
MSTLPDTTLRIAPALLFGKSAWHVTTELKKHPELGAMSLIADPTITGAIVERGGEVLLAVEVDETTMALESFLR